jgi:glutaminyl-tRNA synthetase
VDVVKDEETGEVAELHCTYDPATKGGYAPDGRKVQATLHWVSAAHSHPAQVRLYDRLFSAPEPGSATGDFRDDLNPHSLETVATCRVEPALAALKPGQPCQFERLGYFCADKDSSPQNLIFNRTVTLKDPWAKLKKGQGG